MNGTDSPKELDLTPYKEILPADKVRDLLTGKQVNLKGKLALEGRENLVMEF